MFPVPHSKRGKPLPDKFEYTISPKARNRIVELLKFMGRNSVIAIERVFHDANQRCRLEHGQGLMSDGGFPDELVNQFVKNFIKCEPVLFLDMLEWFFQSEGFLDHQFAVDGISKVFREEGVGYELTPFRTTRIPIPRTIQLPVSADEDEEEAGGSFRVDVDYPQVIKKTDSTIHRNVTLPVLNLLSNPVFKIANKEMLEAHEHFRAGKWGAAIGSAGQALESVLKTICEKEKWTYKPDKDTLNILLQTCEKNNLFPAPFTQVIQQSSGTIRNKFGAHGQGPQQIHGPATEAIADSMIQLTSSNILFLAKQAGMV